MQLSWHGLSCFEIKAKTQVGEAVVVTDPYDNSTGLHFPRTLEANAVTVSHNADDANNVESVLGEPFVVTIPGEYEIKDVFLFAKEIVLKNGGKNLLLKIEAEGMRLAHLGALDRLLTNEELAFLQNIDVLMVPVGGVRVLDPKGASEVMSQIEPRVVIPMTHKLENLKESFGGVDAFCKELGVCRKEEATKYKFSKKDLPEEDTLIMVLSR